MTRKLADDDGKRTGESQLRGWTELNGHGVD